MKVRLYTVIIREWSGGVVAVVVVVVVVYGKYRKAWAVRSKSCDFQTSQRFIKSKKIVYRCFSVGCNWKLNNSGPQWYPWGVPLHMYVRSTPSMQSLHTHSTNSSTTHLWRFKNSLPRSWPASHHIFPRRQNFSRGPIIYLFPSIDPGTSGIKQV